MYEFISYFDDIVHTYPMHFDLYYSKTWDWKLDIWKKGCDENGKDLVIFSGQDTDVDLLIAKAHVALKEHLLEVKGGY